MTLKSPALLLTGLSVFAHCHLNATEKGDDATAPSFADRLRAAYERIPLTRTVYGRVVDQDGNGVGGADIELHWTPADWLLGKPERINRISIKTDARGHWETTLTKPADASIRNVTKEGYVRVYNEKEFPRDPVNFPTTKDNPVVAVLRKKGPPAFLIVSPGGGGWPDVLFQTDGTNAVSRPLDLLAWSPDYRGTWKFSATTNADLRIDAAFDAAEKRWNVMYSITNGPGGVILSDELLYEAPPGGYVRNASATLTNRYDQQKYLYVKSRTPAMYSRVRFVHDVHGREAPSLRVSCAALTNPYGDRTFEYDDRTDYELVGGLAAAAKAALAAGRYPERPDIARLSEETKERREKRMAEEKERQERYEKSPEYLEKVAADKRRQAKSKEWREIVEAGKGLAPGVMSVMREETVERAAERLPGYPVVARAVAGLVNDPVADAEVTVHFTRDDAQRTALPGTQTRRTNAAGDFHFFVEETNMPVRVWLSAGRARSSVSPNNFDPAKADTYVRRPPLFWFAAQPGSPEFQTTTERK